MQLPVLFTNLFEIIYTFRRSGYGIAAYEAGIKRMGLLQIILDSGVYSNVTVS